MDPKPVQVVFPDGTEYLGIAVSDNQVYVGPEGVHLEIKGVRCIVQVDGVRRRVMRKKVRLDSPLSGERPQEVGWEVSVLLTHAPEGEG